MLPAKIRDEEDEVEGLEEDEEDGVEFLRSYFGKKTKFYNETIQNSTFLIIFSYFLHYFVYLCFSDFL